MSTHESTARDFLARGVPLPRAVVLGLLDVIQQQQRDLDCHRAEEATAEGSEE